MEDKLYFEPEFSGRKEKRKKYEKKDHRFFKLFLFLLLLLIIVSIIIWLLKGSETVSGQYPENIKNEALICKSDNINYPKITTTNSDKKELKINAIFNGKDTLKDISIIYTLQYGSEAEAYAAETSANIEFVEKLAALGFNSSKFSNKFSRYIDKLIVSLTMRASEINESTMDYLILDPDKVNHVEKYNLNDFQKFYQSIGFLCESTIDNN